MPLSHVSRVVFQAAPPGGFKFYIDWPQAKSVFDALIRRLGEKGPPYNAAHVPQADQYLPENLEKGSRQHAIFLFMLCLWMRGGVESDTAARFLKQMYEEKPEVFEPQRYWGWNQTLTAGQLADVVATLKKYNLGQRVEENARGWVYNLRKLDRFWSGDPRKLMNDEPSFKTLAKRIMGKTRKKSDKEGKFARMDDPYGFLFFREKMVAMIAYFLMDAKLVPMFYTPVPVDFHVLRLLVANGVIRVQGKSMEDAVGINFMKPATLRLARKVTERYCRDHQVSPIALCDALWLLSRSLCRRNPGNSGFVADDVRKAATASKVFEPDQGEVQAPELDFPKVELKVNDSPSSPEGSEGLIGRKRYLGLKYRADELSQPTLRVRLEQSCGLCPVKVSCRYNISSGAYYVAGKLIPERLRDNPPDLQKELFADPSFAPSLRAPVDETVRFAPINMINPA